MLTHIINKSSPQLSNTYQNITPLIWKVYSTIPVVAIRILNGWKVIKRADSIKTIKITEVSKGEGIEER